MKNPLLSSFIHISSWKKSIAGSFSLYQFYSPVKFECNGIQERDAMWHVMQKEVRDRKMSEVSIKKWCENHHSFFFEFIQWRFFPLNILFHCGNVFHMLSFFPLMLKILKYNTESFIQQHKLQDLWSFPWYESFYGQVF